MLQPFRPWSLKGNRDRVGLFELIVLWAMVGAWLGGMNGWSNLEPSGLALIAAETKPVEKPAVPVSKEKESSSAKKLFRAGAAASNITPWLDEEIVGGWTSPKATYIHDELFARCLVLDDGQHRIALVIVDNLGLAKEVCDAAKRQIRQHTGIAEEHVLIAATHTHSSIAARPANVLKPEGGVGPYSQFLARRISDGVRRAVAHLEPTQIGWAVVNVPEHLNNRRWFLKPEVKLTNPFGGLDKVQMNPPAGSPLLVKPAGPVDPELCILAVRSPEGRPIALLANYSLHYVGGVPGGHISADYFGVFADRIQQLLGADRLEPPFVGMLSNGASGDVNNIPFQNPRPPKKPYEQMRYVAYDLAQKVFEAYQKIHWHDWVPLGMQQTEVTLAVRKPTPEQLERARAIVAGAPPMKDRPHEETYARRIIQLHESPDTVQVPLQAVRIGPVGIAAIPFEVFAEIGLELKQKSPFQPTFTISHANGSYGYLPTPAQHALGGYETWLGTSRVEIEASNKIIQAILEMFGKLKEASPKAQTLQ
ncbi:MAG: neutral/alkaline non-lysosomal ceramidase N-terminal domain-containing protein [Thermoguttaceae bacterium]|nr:neutral/alkaline non-lysosomal ceramidase N-terminal domain-containing protein [Thermoguttaceae bacterium]MDW8038200.1 neutral/alkaline non-lysosomal ceramidase N-terminal domain-containing protein [Thermoguttaceae bacterium]